MPKYDYRCAQCGGQQELERSIHAEADNPMCCQATMERIFTVPAIKFNAPGFYSTTP